MFVCVHACMLREGKERAEAERWPAWRMIWALREASVGHKLFCCCWKLVVSLFVFCFLFLVDLRLPQVVTACAAVSLQLPQVVLLLLDVCAAVIFQLPQDVTACAAVSLQLLNFDILLNTL